MTSHFRSRVYLFSAARHVMASCPVAKRKVQCENRGPATLSSCIMQKHKVICVTIILRRKRPCTVVAIMFEASLSENRLGGVRMSCGGRLLPSKCPLRFNAAVLSSFSLGLLSFPDPWQLLPSCLNPPYTKKKRAILSSKPPCRLLYPVPGILRHGRLRTGRLSNGRLRHGTLRHIN